jgi:hypothetical protein
MPRLGILMCTSGVCGGSLRLRNNFLVEQNHRNYHLWYLLAAFARDIR